MANDKATPFRWHPDEPPPRIEPHSKAKLAVLRSYLRAYFDRLNASPFRETFKLHLIDGFAGGGTFLDGDQVVSGTPLIMLEEALAAEERLNCARIKRLSIDCRFCFVDVASAHVDHLRKALNERGHDPDDDRIAVRNARFQDEVDSILDDIRSRQPRTGRAIFLLDQTGFSQVELALVSRIFHALPAAEVILTFAADALVNHLAERPSIAKAVSPLQLSDAHLHDLIELKNGDGGRALVQRTLRDHVRNATGAAYDTPFFIRPDRSRRALWFLHLSRHPTARDVMIQRHWEAQNTFEHYGPGDFAMLGWDSIKDFRTLPLFQFRDDDAQALRDALLESLPAELYALVCEDPVTVDAVRHTFANRTAARFSDLDDTIIRLFQEGEFQILSPEGKPRLRSLRRLHATDRVTMPPTPVLPGFSRR